MEGWDRGGEVWRGEREGVGLGVGGGYRKGVKGWIGISGGG